MPFTLKPGVDQSGVTQELLNALGVAQGVYTSFGQPFTVTSLSEGQHVANSKHYIGQAADLRIRDIDPASLPGIVSGLKSQLGSQYYVLQEGDHIHIQYNGQGTVPDDSQPAYTLDAPEPASGFDLSSIFGPSGDPVDVGVSESSSFDGSLLIALGIAGIAVWFLLRD